MLLGADPISINLVAPHSFTSNVKICDSRISLITGSARVVRQVYETEMSLRASESPLGVATVTDPLSRYQRSVQQRPSR
jgi:hypothetical protein